MPDADDMKDEKDFGIGIPVQSSGFFLKGSNALDWGMKNRLSRIFNPVTGRTVMLAFDHGYFQGPTTGLERMDLARRGYQSCLLRGEKQCLKRQKEKSSVLPNLRPSPAKKMSSLQRF